jgi:hypothetical protein
VELCLLAGVAAMRGNQQMLLGALILAVIVVIVLSRVLPPVALLIGAAGVSVGVYLGMRAGKGLPGKLGSAEDASQPHANVVNKSALKPHTNVVSANKPALKPHANVVSASPPVHANAASPLLPAHAAASQPALHTGAGVDDSRYPWKYNNHTGGWQRATGGVGPNSHVENFGRRYNNVGDPLPHTKAGNSPHSNAEYAPSNNAENTSNDAPHNNAENTSNAAPHKNATLHSRNTPHNNDGDPPNLEENAGNTPLNNMDDDGYTPIKQESNATKPVEPPEPPENPWRKLTE